MVAQASGTTTTFRGSLKTIPSVGDKLAFIYPSQGYTATKDFEPITMALYENEDNSTIPFCAVGIYDINDFAAQPQTDFYFKMSYMKLNMADLPKLEKINSVTIPNVGIASVFTINSSGTDLVHTAIEGTLTVSPSSLSVSDQGYRTINVTFAGGESISPSRRSVIVNCADNVYMSSINGQAIGINKYYNTNVASFSQIGGVYAGHEYIDLGLPSGTMWATEDVAVGSLNINRFAFGETSGSTAPNEGLNQNISTYLKSMGSTMTAESDFDTEKDPMRKYTSTLLSISGSEFDAASVNWGKFWQIPTDAECRELAKLDKAVNNDAKEVTFTSSSGVSITTPLIFWTSTPHDVGKVWTLNGGESKPAPRRTLYAIRPVLSLISLSVNSKLGNVIEIPAEGGLGLIEIEKLDPAVKVRIANKETIHSWLTEGSAIDAEAPLISLPANTDGHERVAKIVFEATWDSNPLFAGKKYTKTVYVYQASNGNSETITDPGWLQ
ncbi:MAG: hypothetical protein MJZ16_12860 [Bacteroidales bacterium]|nr:hypothetical protein [Bacteroidales bacterium]